MILNSGVLGLSLGKYDSYNGFLFLNNSSGVVTAYLTSGVGGSGTPLFAERSASQLLTYTGGLSTPPNSFGYSGDYSLVPTGNYRLFGPKPSDTGAWGVGLDLIISGATGLIGPIGPTGAQGTGVAPSGKSGEILYKNSSGNYDTKWGDAVDVLKKRKLREYGDYSDLSNGGSFVLKDENGITINNAGRSMTYSKITSCFYVTSGSDKYVRCFSQSFKFLYKKELTFVVGANYGIEWVKDEEFLIASCDFTNTPKIHKVSINSLSASSISVYDTGMPPATPITSVCYDNRNDTVYFAQRYSESSNWGIFCIYNGYSLSPSISYVKIFDVEASDLNGGAHGVLGINDIHCNEKSNTLACLLYGDGNSWIYEIDLKTWTAVNDNMSGETIQGLSVVEVDTAVYGDSFFCGFCFREDDKYMYLSAENVSDGHITILSKDSQALVIRDTPLDFRNYIYNSSTTFSPIENKIYQSLGLSTKSESQSPAWTGNGIGVKNIYNASEGMEIYNECYGKLNTYKTTSIFPRNYGQGGGSITSNDYPYLTGSYYLELPSGLSGVNWKYTSEITFRDVVSGGVYINKSIQSHFQVFSTPKLELFYSEYGPCSISSAYDTDMSVTFAPSGSGSFSLYSQKITVR